MDEYMDLDHPHSCSEAFHDWHANIFCYFRLVRQRDRPSLDDQLEKSGLLCGRDAMAGGTVLGLQVGAASQKLEGWSSRNLIN